MAYSRKVGFEYYKIVKEMSKDKENESDRYFDFRRWIQKVPKQLSDRTRDYYSEEARLERIYYAKDDNVYFLNFARLRETNIPSKASVDSQTEPIELEDDEYIGEEVTALFDPEYSVLMLQRNRYSLSPSGIEEYINLIWQKENETIKLRPILSGNIFKK